MPWLWIRYDTDCDIVLRNVLESMHGDMWEMDQYYQLCKLNHGRGCFYREWAEEIKENLNVHLVCITFVITATAIALQISRYERL